MPAPTPNPVIFLPGFYGSKLNLEAHDELVWLDSERAVDGPATMAAIHFDSADPDRLVAGGILEEVGVLPFFSVDVYRDFLNFLRNKLHLTVSEFSFDWRRSLLDSVEKLRRQIQTVLTQNGADKVNLLAHSQGGLVARACLAQYPDLAGQVDWLVTFGTPHHGMLETFQALLGERKFLLFTAADLMAAARTAPGAFELLPSDPAENLFIWNGISSSALAVPAWCATPAMQQLLAAARTVVSGLPNALPVRAALVYGTRLETLVAAVGTTAGGVQISSQPQGDSTVPAISGRGNRLTAATLLRFALPQCDHSALFGDDQLQAQVLTPLLQGHDLAPVMVFSAFAKDKFFVPKEVNRLTVVVQDSVGNPIQNAAVKLSITGTQLNQQPLQFDPANSDYVLDVQMPSEPGAYRWTLQVSANGKTITQPPRLLLSTN